MNLEDKLYNLIIIYKDSCHFDNDIIQYYNNYKNRYEFIFHTICSRILAQSNSKSFNNDEFYLNNSQQYAILLLRDLMNTTNCIHKLLDLNLLNRNCVHVRIKKPIN